MSEDDFEAGMDLCLKGYRRLASLDPDHELLRFGEVQPGDTVFYVNQENEEEFDRIFAKEGVHPKGTRACAYAFGQYFVALRNAADSIERGLATKVR